MSKKFIPILAILLLSLSFAAAHSDTINVDYKEKITKTNYYPDDGYSITHTVYSDYDNDDRHSTYDYRWGYSYRTSREYWDDNHFDDKVDYREYDRYDNDRRDGRDYDRYDRNDRRYDRDYDYYRGARKDVYYKYISYLDKYERHECYHEAPRGRLFYIRCP